MNNPTAGSWRATKIGASVFAMIDGVEITLAHVDGTGSERKETANLIAAAPDMLDALNAVATAYYIDGERCMLDGILIQAVEAAIAKARGEV